ncbi:MAG: acetoacetate decarboxylase [Solirubrobacterales bacterium]|nr:acetoacetate decarboxylase [Solirubrobacterales bacterium]
MTLKGYSTPRTPSGKAGLVPPPPWHYAADFLVVDYWADPDVVTSLLPEGMEPHPDPGRCAAIFADWQSSSDSGEEILDPARGHYKEFFIVANALLDGEEVTTCVFIWVDQDFAMARGWIQGFPKKLGTIWMTRTFGLACAADPGVASGSKFGAVCTARGHLIAKATVTLEGVSENGPEHNAAPIVNVRHFPRLSKGDHEDPQVHELVRAASRDRASSEIWEGEATLELSAAPGEEHELLVPVKLGRGYRFSFGYTVDDLETVKVL